MFGEALDSAWQNLLRWATTGISQDSYLRNVPARWRALKRLAIQGHDTAYRMIQRRGVRRLPRCRKASVPLRLN